MGEGSEVFDEGPRTRGVRRSAPRGRRWWARARPVRESCGSPDARPTSGLCRTRCFMPHPHTSPKIGEEKLDTLGRKDAPGPPLVRGAPFASLQKCRAPLIRYDKKAINYLGLMRAINYLGLIQLACGLLWYRRRHRLLQAQGVFG